MGFKTTKTFRGLLRLNSHLRLPLALILLSLIRHTKMG